MRLKFSIGGMSCSACSARVERVVNALPGVERAEVNLLSETMVAEFDDTAVSSDDIVKVVTRAGFTAEIYKRSSGTDKAAREHHVLLRRLIVSFLLLIPLMYLSMQHMFHYPLPYIFDNGIVLAVSQFILTVPVIAVNFGYWKRGFKNLFTGAANMDTLIAVGSAASVLYGIYTVAVMIYKVDTSYPHNLYFESAAMILTLITLGKFFESRAKARAGDAIKKLSELAPDEVSVLVNGNEINIPADALMVGDIIIARAGNTIAADGTVIKGTADADESAVTGESLPAEKNIGDGVISGTVITGGYIEFRADKTGDDTVLAEIIRLVDEAASSKAPIARLADKISGIFVPVVMGISVVTFIIWLILGAEISVAINFAISVLVISCPCALGLATPVAVMVGTGTAASHGILLQNSESLETAHSLNAVILDKTGTVTEGIQSVDEVVSFIDEQDFLKLAYSIERLSGHPIAAAVCAHCEENGVDYIAADGAETLEGRGIGCTVSEKNYYSGNAALAKEHGIDIGPVENILNNAAMSGKTPVIFFDDEKILGIISVVDKIKATSASAVKKLQKMGIEVYMITGDNKLTAAYVADRVGIKNVFAETMPQGKEMHVRNLKKSGMVVGMVGDGINDAPALVSADVGIAIGAGTDIAMKSADIILVRSDLNDAVSAIKLSRSVIKNIKMNLFWAFFYNVVGIPIAAGALSALGIVLNPMLASAAMSMSSVCVVLNSLRLKGALKNEKNT